MASRFVPNPALPALVGTLISPYVKSTTEKVADFARAIAPVETGAFASSIETDYGVGKLGEVTGRVVSNIRYAAYIEFGTSDTPTFATFYLAAAATRL
jgi:hypothetical protein